MTVTVAEEVWQAADAVVMAAEHVVSSYRQRGGYSVPLSHNLRSLEAAIYVWQKAMHATALDSDINGFDRSSEWPGKESHSNEQSSEADTQRRGCAKASQAANDSSAEAEREGAVRPGAA